MKTLRLVFLALFALLTALPAFAQGQLTVSAPETLSERRISRTVFEYVLRASVSNSAASTAKGVVATCTSTSPTTTVVEGTLTIGNVAAQGSAASVDTITIAHDRTVPFDPAVLQWTFVKVPDAPSVLPPASPSAAASTTLTGSAEPGATVEIVGGASTVTGTASGTGTFSVSVPLQPNRANKLFVAAVNAAGRSEPVPVTVTQDTVPPSLFIDFPADGATLTNESITVAGRVGDMLSGFLGLGVTVNGQPGNVVVGLGNNGTFERGSVPLALGANTITATAADVNGNTVTRTITVTRVAITGPRMTVISGDMQSARVHEKLAAPILVRITNADGTPFPGKVVTFEVTRSDGRLSTSIQPTDVGGLMLQMLTDADGYAWAYWTLGSDAGCGNNRVSVTSKDIAGTITFCATARPSPPRQLNIGSGNNQRAEAGGLAAEPLKAWVSDSCNGIGNVPVTFTVTQGGGKVNGQDSVTVNTTTTGHAEVQFTLGPDAGQNVVEANFPGHPGLPATFTAYGIVRDATKPTTFTGLVLDNTSQPIGGATCNLTVGGTTFTTTSDIQGRFVFEPTTLNPTRAELPSGVADLTVNGLSATSLGGVFIQPNSFPGLSYTATLIPNAENSLATPVLLPRLNPNNARNYDGTTDLVLTCEGMAGLKMTIKAGSMRKFDGSLVSPTNPAVVSLNQVHHDQIPMPIPDGASPPFAWTLQPARATFDPPIQVEYPNMSGLPAGSIAYFLTYNHDTEKFEIFASGHVTPDASTILTDPGAGLTVSGWGCNCPPYSVAGDCNNCLCLEAQRSPAATGLAPPPGVADPCKPTPAELDNGCGPAWVRDIIGEALQQYLVNEPSTFANSLIAIGRQNPAFLFSPDLDGKVDFSGICRDHDFGYQTLPPSGIDLTTWKRIADNQFLIDGRQGILNQFALGDLTRDEALRAIRQVELYHSLFADTTDGDKSFNEGMKEALDRLKQCLAQPPPQADYKTRTDNSGIVSTQASGLEFADIPDSDNDGLDDDWERSYGLSVGSNDVYLDSDGDGVITGLEYKHDLNPMSRDSLGDGRGDAFTFFDRLERGSVRIDNTWQLSVGGQTAYATRAGLIYVRNISAPDQFGAGGPGTIPDFIGDDPVRVTGVSYAYSPPKYVFSGFFRIPQGQRVSIGHLTFTNSPVRKPEALAAAPDQATLTALGQTTQLRVAATFADRTTSDVTPATSWTSYRTSNTGVARVDANGLVTTTGPGIAYITAVNEGSSSVAQLTVVPGDPLTTVIGFVRRPDGSAAVGASVSISGLGLTATVAADGQFSFANVPTTLGPLTLSTVINEAGGFLVAVARNLAPVPAGVVDAGILTLAPATDTALSFDGGDQVSIPDNAVFHQIEAGDAVTIEAWIMVNGYPQGWFPIAEKYRTATDFGWVFQIFGGASPTVQFIGGPGPTAVAAFTPQMGVWTHVAVAYRRSEGVIRFFVNGAPIGSPAFSADIQTTDTGAFYIGYGPSGGDEYALGRIDDVRLWNRALSATEIAANYRTRLTGSETGLVGYWRFDEGAGLSVADSTVSGLVGALGTGTRTPQWVAPGAITLVGAEGELPSLPPFWTALPDIDADGFTDAQEAIAGTDARDAASALRIGAIRASGTDVVLEFGTVPGRIYAIECCTDLARGEWFVVQDQIAGTGQPIRIQDFGAATREPRCFYRLRVTLP